MVTPSRCHRRTMRSFSVRAASASCTRSLIPNVAAVALSAKSVIFGDFGAYFVRIAGGIRFERSSDFAFNTDQITFKAVLRGDGILADQTGAIKVFTGNAA